MIQCMVLSDFNLFHIILNADTLHSFSRCCSVLCKFLGTDHAFPYLEMTRLYSQPMSVKVRSVVVFSCWLLVAPLYPSWYKCNSWFLYTLPNGFFTLIYTKTNASFFSNFLKFWYQQKAFSIRISYFSHYPISAEKCIVWNDINPRLTEQLFVTQRKAGGRVVTTIPSDFQNEPPYDAYFGTNG